MKYVIEAKVGLDPAFNNHIFGTIGPFDTPDDANTFLEQFNPLWGSWHVTPVRDPEEIIKHVGLTRGR